MSDGKVWLWRNFVDGKPEYWAFDNPFPVYLDNDDPHTLGEPCGYALVKPSRNGRPDVPESEVLAAIARALSDSSPRWIPVSERLPEPFNEDGNYQVFIAHESINGERYVEIEWAESVVEMVNFCRDANERCSIIAWVPLAMPAPPLPSPPKDSQ